MLTFNRLTKTYSREKPQQPQDEPQESGANQVEQPKRKRGRPPGSKNKIRLEKQSQLQQPQQQHLRIPDCIQSSYRGQLRSNKRALERL